MSVLVAALVALPIGIVLGHVRTGGAIAVNIANIGRALPALALLILSVQWVGIGDPTGILTPVQSVPAFIAMFALAVPPMLANAYVGMANVDDEIRESARGMGMNGRQMIWRVELPERGPAGDGRRAHRDGRGRRHRDARRATSTPAGFGRYIVDGFAVQDNVKVFAGGLLVALLAIALELRPRAGAAGDHVARHPGRGEDQGPGPGHRPSRGRRHTGPLRPAVGPRTLTRQILTDSLRFRRTAPG